MMPIMSRQVKMFQLQAVRTMSISQLSLSMNYSLLLLREGSTELQDDDLNEEDDET